MSSIMIELHPEKLPLLIIEQDGNKTSKYVYADQIIHMLASSVDENTMASFDQVALSSPALPPGTVKYSKSARGKDYFFMTVDETSHDITYNQFSFEDVSYPKMVFAFAVAGKQLVEVYCAAYKDTFLRDTTELFRFPYSNVHSNGKLCYFTNEPVHDLVQLQTFPYQWRDVKNNDHIYFAGETNQIKDTLFNVYKRFEGQPFDYNILTPMHKTFEAWAEEFIRAN